jgi:hypothetical protein
VSRAEGFDWRGLKILVYALPVGMLATLWFVFGHGPPWLPVVVWVTLCAAGVGLFMHTRAMVHDARGRTKGQQHGGESSGNG